MGGPDGRRARLPDPRLAASDRLGRRAVLGRPPRRLSRATSEVSFTVRPSQILEPDLQSDTVSHLSLIARADATDRPPPRGRAPTSDGALSHSAQGCGSRHTWEAADG